MRHAWGANAVGTLAQRPTSTTRAGSERLSTHTRRPMTNETRSTVDRFRHRAGTLMAERRAMVEELLWTKATSARGAELFDRERALLGHWLRAIRAR